MREIKLYTGLTGMILWHFSLERAAFKLHFKYFVNNRYEKKYIDYVEITPYNKGNLYKIRASYNRGMIYNVYYGTQKIAYCTTLQSVLKVINNE